jgi:hypothetical protein
MNIGRLTPKGEPLKWRLKIKLEKKKTLLNINVEQKTF